jgi:membrane protein implicated in regulation of membrane protease activity
VQIRTIAAVIVWIVVALLLLNRIFMADWVLPIAIVLTAVALLLYFSPRFMNKKKQQTPDPVQQ